MFNNTRAPALRAQHNKPIVALVGVMSLLGLLSLAPAQRANCRDKNPTQEAKPQKDDDTVRLHSDLVVVNLIVTDAKGQYAHGLKEKDFTILEDDRAQPISTFFAEEAPFAAAILIDTSGSMDYKFGLARAAAASFVDHIRENDQVAVFGFNNEIRMFQDFSDLHDISEYIWDAKAENMTRLYDCVFEALTALGKRPEKRKAILVISDGWDTTSSRASFDSVMKMALSAGVTIYSVDLIDDSARIGSASWSAELRRGMAELREFALRTGGRYIHSPQGDKLEEEFVNVVDELRNQYTITYYPTNAKRDGRWRKLGVAVSRKDLTTRTRKGYWAPKG